MLKIKVPAALVRRCDGHFDQTVDFRALSNQTWSIINIPEMHKGPHSSFNGVILGFSLCDLVDVVVLFCRHTAGFVGRTQK